MNVLIYLYDGIIEEVRVMSSKRANEEYDRWISDHGYSSRDEYWESRDGEGSEIDWHEVPYEG